MTSGLIAALPYLTPGKLGPPELLPTHPQSGFSTESGSAHRGFLEARLGLGGGALKLLSGRSPAKEVKVEVVDLFMFSGRSSAKEVNGEVSVLLSGRPSAKEVNVEVSVEVSVEVEADLFISDG
jgi:hypothetical protein